jgi:C4-dicarboxylate-specific signal transduction histidine kinase
MTAAGERNDTVLDTHFGKTSGKPRGRRHRGYQAMPRPCHGFLVVPIWNIRSAVLDMIVNAFVPLRYHRRAGLESSFSGAGLSDKSQDIGPTMFRSAAIRPILVLVACCILVPPSAMAAPTRNVLMLYSNNRLLPANIEIDRGFRETIAAPTTRNTDIFAEFLDVPAFSGPAYEQDTATYLRQKYAARPPDSIVVAGESALGFVLRHRAELFPDIPVVHVAVAKAFLQSSPPLPPDVIGVPVEYDALGTVELALRFHPNARRLVAVTGSSAWDRERESALRAGLARLQQPPVEFLAGLPTADVVKRLREFGSDDVVYTPGYFKDGAGREFVPRESVVLMAAASGAPVYGPYSTFIGTGVVGGRMPTYIDMGREAAKSVNRLLDGDPISAIRLPAGIPAVTQVDWRQARRWGISEGKIPPDAIVHFREPTFWETYRTQAIVAAVVILLEAGLIVALLIERRLRRRTAAALEESEKRITLAAHAARLSMWMWDLTHDKVWATAKLRQRAGLSKETPVSFDQILRTVYPADRDRFDRAVREAAANNRELDVEYRVIQPDGEVRWFAARGHVASNEGQCLTGVKMDITPRKAAELQAEKDRSALTHISRVSMMGQLSAAIAHQLNQPLAAILGNAETARKMLGREQADLAELREILDDIVTEDNRAAEVIRRLGALYKRGEMPLAPLDLNELVRETLDLVRAELTIRQVETVIELDPSLPSVDGGRVQLQQVLLNLILNAADSMSSVDTSKRILVIRTTRDGESVQLCVVDRGTGIAPEDIKRVFDAYWTTKAGGVGVGLAICYSIITAHRGTITAANNPDGGATFCFTLPVRSDA